MCNSRIKTLVELFCNLLVFHIFHDSHIAFAVNANCSDARGTSLVAEQAGFFWLAISEDAVVHSVTTSI